MKKKIVQLIMALCCATFAFTFLLSSTTQAANSIVASGPTLLHPTTAHAAAVTCSGSGCNNQSPVTTGCNHANANSLDSIIVLDNTGRTIGQAFLEWSSTCQTNWGVGSTNYSYWQGTMTVYRNSGSDGGTESYSVGVNSTVTNTTHMVYSPHNSAYVCLTMGPYSNCTSAH